MEITHTFQILRNVTIAAAICLTACTACDPGADRGTAENTNGGNATRNQEPPRGGDEQGSEATEVSTASPSGGAEHFDITQLTGTPFARADGQQGDVDPDEYGDSPILLIYWGIWCHTCHEELAALAQWQREHASTDLRMVAIHNDGPEFHERAATEIERSNWPFDTLLPTAEQLASWNPRGLTPTTILLRSDGSITARMIGFGSAERRELFDLLTRFE